MANIKTITKKLINNGYSENKLMMMTEKEIREAYKTLKEDSSMNKTIKVRRDSHESFESWIDRINKLLSSNGIHLDNNKLLTIVDDEETDCVSIEDELINVYGWCAGEPYYCYYDLNGNLKQYSNEGTNFEPVEVKEESTMKKDNNTTATNNSATKKEEITMTNEMIKVTVNVEGLNEVLAHYGIELVNSGDCTWVGSTDTDNDVITVTQTPSQYRKGIATMIIREDVYKTIEKDLSIVCNNSTNNKEETIMRELMNNTINRIETATKVQDAEYVTRDELADIMERLTGVRPGKKVTRKQMVQDLYVLEDDLQQIENAEMDSDNSITAGDLDITHDNAPESIEESTFIPVEFNDGLATKILEKVIYQADTNKAHNFISDWMLTSIISELIIGLPLKDKGVEHYKTFTDEQKKNLAEIRKAFIKRAKLIAKYNNSKITGYYIPAKMLVWGRHKYLGVACVYRFMSGNKVAAEYHVSLNGIKNIATGTITTLDDNAYATLDSKCVFVM